MCRRIWRADEASAETHRGGLFASIDGIRIKMEIYA